MNRVFRIVFNIHLGLWQVVSECARKKGKGGGRGSRRRPSARAAVVGAAGAAPARTPAWAALGAIAAAAALAVAQPVAAQSYQSGVNGVGGAALPGGNAGGGGGLGGGGGAGSADGSGGAGGGSQGGAGGQGQAAGSDAAQAQFTDLIGLDRASSWFLGGNGGGGGSATSVAPGKAGGNGDLIYVSIGGSRNVPGGVTLGGSGGGGGAGVDLMQGGGGGAGGAGLLGLQNLNLITYNIAIGGDGGHAASYLSGQAGDGGAGTLNIFFDATVLASGRITVGGAAGTGPDSSKAGAGGLGILRFDGPGTVAAANGILVRANGRIESKHSTGVARLEADISGAGTFTQTGAGTTVLVGNDTRTGSTTVSAGTLQIGDGGMVGSLAGNVALTSTAATLAFNRAGTLTHAGVISGPGQVWQTGSGVTTLSGANTYTGGTSVYAGTLALDGAGTLASTGAVALMDSAAVFDIAGVSGNRTIGALSGVTGSTVTLGANTLAFGDASNQTFAGLISGTGGLVKNGAGVQTLTGINTFGGGVTLNAGGLLLGNNGAIGNGALAVGGAASLDGTSALNLTNAVNLGAALTLPGTQNLTLSGVVSGGGGLLKNGAAVLTLNGANTYTGGTTINAGALAIGAGGSLAATGAVNLANIGTTFDISGAGIPQGIGSLAGAAGSTVQLGGNTLTLNGVGNASFAGVVNGTGGLVKEGTGVQTLAGANTFSGGVALNAGGLALGNNAALGTGTLTVGGNSTLDASIALALHNAIALANGINLNLLGSNALTLGGAITDGGGLVKDGAATVTLTGANTYTGGTTINNGTLAIGAGGSLASTGAVNLAGTGALDISAGGNQAIGSLAGVAGSTVSLGGNSLTVGGANADTTFAGSIGGSGGLVKDGTGSLTLNGGSTFRGGVTLNSGGLAVGNNGALGTGTVTVGGAATLDSNTAVTLANNVVLNAGLSVLGSNNLTLNGALSGTGGLTKQGQAMLTLNGTNTYTGGTFINGGTLGLGAGASLAATGIVNVALGATFDLSAGNGTQVFGTLTGSGAVNLGNNNLEIGGPTNGTYSGSLGGSGGVIKVGTGTQTLTGANTYTGGTTINAGTLAIGAGGSLAATGAVNLANTGTTFDISGAITPQGIGSLAGVAGSTVQLGSNTLTLNGVGNTSFAGVVDSAGGLVKEGAGVQTLTGANVFRGGVALNAGGLALGNNAALGTGTLTVGGNSTLDSTVAGLTVGNNVQLANGTLSLLGSNALTLNGGLAGAGGLLKDGAATVNLGGASSYTGTTTISHGTLAVAAGGSLSRGSTVNLAGTGTLDISAAGNQSIGGLAGVAGSTVALGGATLTTGGNNASTTFGGTLAGSGGLVQGGTGTLTLTGNNTYTGSTRVSSGRLLVNGVVAGDVQVDGGTTLGGSGRIGGSVTVAGTLAPGNSPGTLTVGGNLTLQASSRSQFELNQPNVVGGADNDLVNVGGDLTLDGTLEAQVAAAGWYTLFTYGGTLRGAFSSEQVSSSGSGFAIDSYQLDLSRYGQVNLSVIAAGQGLQFWQGGSGIWGSGGTWGSVPGTADSSWGGSVGVFAGSAGTVTVSGPQAFDTLQFASNGYRLLGDNLALSPVSGRAATLNVDNGATATIGNRLVDGSGNALTKVGGGTVILTGANSYSGGTTISAGTLQIGNGGTTGSIVGNVSNNGVLAFNRSDDFGFSGVVSGSGSLQQAGSGTTTLTGTNSYSGGTTISAGTLQIGNGGTTGSIVGNVSNNGVLAFNRSDDFGFAGSVSGSGSLQQGGSGSLDLTGDHSYSGGTFVQSGRLAVNGSISGDLQVARAGTLGGSGSIGGNVTVAGTLAPGNSPGTLSIGGNLTLLSGSISQFELSQPGVVGGAQNDLVKVGGNLTLGGELKASVSSAGWYRLFNYGGRVSGQFDSTTVTSTQPGSFTVASHGVVNVAKAGQIALSVLGTGQTLQFWNGNHSTGGSAIGGNGKWSGFDSNWTDASGTAHDSWAGSVAVFAGEAGTVAVEGSMAFDTLQFASDGYRVQAASTGGELVIAPASGNSGLINVDANVKARIDAAIVDGVGNHLTKVGEGTLTLSGGNRYSGGTTVNEGTLIAASDTALGKGDIRVDNAAGKAATVQISNTLTLGNAITVNNGGRLDNAGSIVRNGAGDIAVDSITGGAVVNNLGTGSVIQGAAVGVRLQQGGSISNAAGATIQGSEAIRALSGSTTLSNAGQLIGSVQLHDASANQVTLFTGSQIQGDLAIGSHAGSILTLDGNGTQLYSQAVSGASTFAGSMSKLGSGSWTLDRATSHAGTTNVAAGSLKAGAANVFSAASNHTVASGASLDLAGFSQKIAGLNNSGTVSLLGSTPGTVLTVTGAWVGNNGLLAMGTQLGSDNSATDKLLLSGSNAVASGSTRIAITNLGGLGARTTGDGIQIVGTDNGGSINAGAFSLAGPVVAGAYEYKLNTTSSGAYLSNTLTPDPEVIVPLYRSEASLYGALPAQLREAGTIMLGSLGQRIGDASDIAEQGHRQAWARAISADRTIDQSGVTAASSRGRLNGLQVGSDLWADANTYIGAYLGQLSGDMSVRGLVRGNANHRAGYNKQSSRYLGAYAGWSSDAGLYVEGVVQAGRNRTVANPDQGISQRSNGNSLLASVEVGQSFALSPQWRLQPQLQLLHQQLDLDDVRVVGADIQQRSADSWQARAGARITGEFATGRGTLQPYARAHYSKRGGGSDVARFITPTAVTDIASRVAGSSVEVAAGLSWQLNPAARVYGEVGTLASSSGAAQVKGGANGSVGIALGW